MTVFALVIGFLGVSVLLSAVWMDVQRNRLLRQELQIEAYGGLIREGYTFFPPQLQDEVLSVLQSFEDTSASARRRLYIQIRESEQGWGREQ